MKTKYILIMGLLLLALAALWKFALAHQWTQRLPPDWTWQADYFGVGTYPDPSTGDFPADDSVTTYQRSMSILSEDERPTAVTVEDAYIIRDLATGKVTWEYVVRADVNPATGGYLDAELRDQILVFPRHVDKKTYKLRSNYIQGIPLTYQSEEVIEGLATYRFAYEGGAEYTESYRGTDQYPGVPVEEGQEIKCADDQFQFKAWVEPYTGEILKVEENCLAGDYIYDIASGQKLAAVLRWSGATAGDDLLIRADKIRVERTRLQWVEIYIPAIIAFMGMILLAGAGVKHFYRLPPITGYFTSLASRAMLGQAAGLGFAISVTLVLLQLGIRAQVYEEIRTTGLAVVESVENLITPELMLSNAGTHQQKLDESVDRFIADFPVITRLSIVDYRMQVVADSSNFRLGSVSDQSDLIKVMQEPNEDATPLIYTRQGQHYMRLSQAIHGLYDSARNSDVIGAVSVDVSLLEPEDRINTLFRQAIGGLVVLVAIQMGLAHLFLRRSVLSPLRVLKRAAQQIERGQLGARAPIDIPNELGDMGHAFNSMAEQIQRTSEALRENSESLQTIIQTSPLAMIKIDTAENVVMWNPAAEVIFGWSEAEAWGRPLRTFPSDKRAEASAIYEALQQHQSLTNITSQWLSKDGRRVDVNISAIGIHDLVGNITGFNMIIADISSLKHAEEAMKASNKSLSISVAKLEQRTRELSLSAEMADLLQACNRPEEAHFVLMSSLQKIFPEMSGILYEIPPSRDLMEPIASWGPNANADPFVLDGCWALRRGRSHRTDDGKGNLVCQHVTDDLVEPVPYMCVPMMAQGEAFGVLHLRVAPGMDALLVENQRLAETVAEQVALTLANLKLREALRQQSIRDMLTGLFNRRYLEETLIREIERAKRGRIPLSVIMMDLDHFKQFNDTYGHRAGDVVLKTLGKFLQTHVRADDIACRYGGEEFTLIMPGASQEIAQQRAEQMRDGIHTLEISYEDQILGALTLSLGVAVFPAHGGNGESILQAADVALYRAKQNGRDRVELAG